MKWGGVKEASPGGRALAFTGFWLAAFTALAAPKTIDPGYNMGLWNAICQERPDRVKQFLDLGADPNGYVEGLTMLNEAAFRGQLEIAQILVEQGADLEKPTLEGGVRPLANAARKNRLEVVKYLLDRGAAIDGVDKQGWTALMHAAFYDKPDAVKLLLERGANPNLRDENGRNALMKTYDNDDDRIESLRYLLGKGADPNLKDKSGGAALHWLATWPKGEAFLQVLIEGGADPNLRDNEGSTPLMSAASHGNDGAVLLFLAKGADINAKNNDGETALMKAGQRGYGSAVQLLINAGAKEQKVLLNRLPKPEKPLSPAQGWALATPGIIVQRNGENLSILGYEPVSDRDSVIKGLKEWWNIDSREKALKTLDWLAKSGHRAEFDSIGRQIAPLTAEQFNNAIASVQNPKLAAKLRVVRQYQKELGARSILAWDLCRYIYVAGQCYVAGYLSEDEAWAMIMPVARELQKNFKSWEDMGQNYLLGREYWGGSRDPRFDYIFRLFLNSQDPNSPWNRYPWQTDLSK